LYKESRHWSYLTTSIIEDLAKNTSDKEFKNLEIDDEILKLIAINSGCEVRQSLNTLELLEIYEGKITNEILSDCMGKKNLKLDSKDINYYDLLSALQKSIRGSDVDASLYYLARLIKLEDLDIIIRRLSVIAYEDIGLANPQVGPRVYCACEQALRLGLPEARIPLSYAVIDLALSPKSNSSEAAIDNALNDIENLPQYDIPKNILNREIKGNSRLYKYPHDYPNDIVYQEYMPKEIRDHRYYIPKETGKYEKALKEYNIYVKKILKKE
jgi:putative ATPase